MHAWFAELALHSHWPFLDGLRLEIGLQALSALPADSIATSISHSLTWLVTSMHLDNCLPVWRLT